MKLIKQLKVDYDFFIINFNELKKIKINNLTVLPFITKLSQPDETHLTSTQVVENIEKIKEFLSYNNPDDENEISSYEFIYDSIQYSYLMYLYKEKKLNFNDPILLKSGRFILFLLMYRLMYFRKEKEFDLETKKILENNLAKHAEYAYLYAIRFLKKPWKELEQSKNYYDIKLSSIKLEYLTDCIVNNIDFKNTDGESSRVIFDYLINNPIYKKDLDILLSSKNLIEWTLKGLFSFNYFRKLDEYIFNNFEYIYVNHFYSYMYFNSLNQKIEKFDLKEVRKRIYETPTMLILFIDEFQRDKDIMNEIYNNSEIINKNMLKDLKSLAVFLNFIAIKKQKYFFDFMDNNLNIIDDIFEAIKDDSVLSNFTSAVAYYYLQDIKDEFLFSDIRRKRFKELFETKFPQVIKKISQYSNSALSYAISTGEQFIEGEKEIFKEPFLKKQYLEMLKKLGPKEIKNYDSYDFSEIK